MHQLLERHLKRAGLEGGSPPADPLAWCNFLDRVSRAYTEADQDRYLLERSLSLSSDEMRGLQEDLAKERDALKTVILSLTEGLCALDVSGSVLFINPEACRLLGLAAKETVGRPLTELVDLHDDQGRPFAHVLADRDSHNGAERRLLVGSDRSTFIVCTLSPMGDAGGVVVVLRDVTDRHRSEKEREELNRRLMDASRQAGMAEVATGVLHNVGNVLNSVNVSVTLTSERVKHSRLAGLEKAAALLRANEARLGEFLTTDTSGRQLPAYLTKLAGHLADEQRAVLEELESLTRNVSHIKEIVSTQQTYAKGVGLRERESIEAIAEEALRINAESLARHSIQVVREYTPAPQVLVDKHQVLQILINFIANAKNALSGLAKERRRMTVRVRSTTEEPRRVSVEIADEGVGIAPENLNRIFQHGFTTRKGGHGFGLHSAALAAKSLGAKLSVHSDGPDRGAVFTLDLPVAEVPRT